jgi:hypothetical protein
MEYRLNNSKNLPLKKTQATKSINIIHFPWRDKKLRRRFHWTEFTNPKLKKIVLESGSKDLKDKGKGEGSGHGKGKGKGRRNDNDDEGEHNTYCTIELIDEPTKWYLRGKEVKASTWYRYTISNQNEFYEWGLIRIVKEINNLLRLGCTIKEII